MAILRGVRRLKNLKHGPKYIITVKIYENAPAKAIFEGIDCKLPAGGDITMATRAMRRSRRQLQHDIRRKQTLALKQEANDAGTTN